MSQFTNPPGKGQQENSEIKGLLHSLGHHIGTFLLLSRDNDNGMYGGQKHLEASKEFINKLLQTSKNPEIISILGKMKVKIDSIKINSKTDNDLLDNIDKLLEGALSKKYF